MAAMTKPEAQRPQPPKQAPRSAALPTVEPQTLRAFAAVAREGHVSRAAQRLHLSQPAVSLQLKTLAEATGLQLFARTPQGMALTRDGAALLPLADKALAALADFGQAAAALHTTVRGTLRIGTILDPEFTRLGAFLKQLVETSPQVGTELSQSMSGDVLARAHNLTEAQTDPTAHGEMLAIRRAAKRLGAARLAQIADAIGLHPMAVDPIVLIQ